MTSLVMLLSFSNKGPREITFTHASNARAWKKMNEITSSTWWKLGMLRRREARETNGGPVLLLAAFPLLARITFVEPSSLFLEFLPNFVESFLDCVRVLPNFVSGKFCYKKIKLKINNDAEGTSLH